MQTTPNLTAPTQKATSKLLKAAQRLVERGYTPVPLVYQKGKLVPCIAWKNFRLPEDKEKAGKIIERLFTKERVVGIAIKAGEASKLIVIDIDDPDKFNSFYPLEKLKEGASYIVQTKTPGHLHLGFKWDPELDKNRSFLQEYGFELKGSGSLVNIFSIHPELKYQVIKLEDASSLAPLPQDLREKILNLISKPQREEKGKEGEKSPQDKAPIPPSKIIEIAAKVYQQGQRQYWTIYTAGCLRKLGFDLEETKTALEAFLREQGDEELEMRMAGIEHTYKQPIEEVKGLKGLIEIGLSAEDSLKLVGKVVQAISKKKGLTLKEILNMQIKEPTWLIPNILPEGFNLLAGKPKVGKSWLALQMALTCVQLGKRVVYYALEDTPARLQKRLKTLGIESAEGIPNLLFFFFELPSIDRGAIDELKDCIEEYKPDLIIIDPLARIKPYVKGKDVFTEEYRALEKLKEITKEGVSLLLVHHARKMQSDDPLDEVLGSTGQTAVADNIMILKRARGEKAGALYLILRDFESLDLGLRFENGWKIEGRAKEVMLAEAQRRIVEAIRTLEGAGEKATVKAIAELVQKPAGAVKVALFELIQKGVVQRKERGIYSLLHIEEKGNLTNFTNLTNLGNFGNLPNFSNLTNFTNHANHATPPTPAPSPLVSKVTSTPKMEVTFSEQNFQGLQEKVTKVSKVTSVSDEVEGTPSTSTSTSTEAVYLLMDESERCINCGENIFETDKASYMRGHGGVKCLKCQHVAWMKFIKADGTPKGRQITKADVDFLLYEPEEEPKEEPKAIEELKEPAQDPKT
jgi:KaiC/GvpD/RAD55 family RecA-like ATPase